MKIKILLFVVLFFTVKGFSQSMEFYQSDSIYKANNIKTRTLFYNWDKSNWRAVDHFNRDGQVVEHAVYDTSGRKYMSRIFSEYDSVTHRLNKQVIYVFGRYDTLARQVIKFPHPDTLTARLEYDSLKRLIRKTLVKSFAKKINSIHEMLYDPYIVTEKYYDDDGTWFESVKYYDDHLMEIKSVTTFHRVNEKSINNVYTFKNTYDKKGKIIRRNIKADIESEVPKFLFKQQEYQYMSSGLLTSRTSYLYSNPDHRIVELFDYKFW